MSYYIGLSISSVFSGNNSPFKCSLNAYDKTYVLKICSDNSTGPFDRANPACVCVSICLEVNFLLINLSPKPLSPITSFCFLAGLAARTRAEAGGGEIVKLRRGALLGREESV